MRGDPTGAIWLAATGVVAGLVFAGSTRRWHGRPITRGERLLMVVVATVFSTAAGAAAFGAIELHGAASAALLFACGAIFGALYGLLQHVKHRQLRRVLWPTLVGGLVMLTLLSTTLREAGRLLAAMGSLLFLAAATLERRAARHRHESSRPTPD